VGMWQLAGASWRGLAEENRNRAPAASARERTRFLPGGTRMWLTEPRWKNGSGELALPHASRGGGSHGIWGDPIRFRCLLNGRTCPPRPWLAGLFFFVFLFFGWHAARTPRCTCGAVAVWPRRIGRRCQGRWPVPSAPSASCCCSWMEGDCYMVREHG
jgi:hypothetical protein